MPCAYVHYVHYAPPLNMCTMCHPHYVSLCTTTMCTMCWPLCHHYVPCSHTGLRRSTPPVSWMAMAYHHTLSYHTILHHMCLCFDCHHDNVMSYYHKITWLRPPYNEKPVSIQVNTREKYELLWFAALWQRYCQHFNWVSSQTLCQTTQNRTTHYSQLRPRYAQCRIQTATSSSICPQHLALLLLNSALSTNCTFSTRRQDNTVCAM